MDKVVQKQLLRAAKIPVARKVWFMIAEYKDQSKKILGLIERKLRYPCFVKPANLGSSVGISKAHNRRELVQAIELAAEYDLKILVEKGSNRRVKLSAVFWGMIDRLRRSRAKSSRPMSSTTTTRNMSMGNRHP